MTRWHRTRFLITHYLLPAQSQLFPHVFGWRVKLLSENLLLFLFSLAHLQRFTRGFSTLVHTVSRWPFSSAAVFKGRSTGGPINAKGETWTASHEILLLLPPALVKSPCWRTALNSFHTVLMALKTEMPRAHFKFTNITITLYEILW